MSSKTCNTCNQNKLLTEYHINKSGRLGHHNVCKVCRGKERKTKVYDKKTEGEKLCKDCNTMKCYKFFSKDKCSTDGCQTYCKDCQHKRLKQYCGTFDGYINRIYRDMINNAKRRNIPVEINSEYLHKLWENQNGKCSLTGEKMTHLAYTSRDQRKRNLYNASIDRIDSEFGYTEDNVHLVLSAINTIKWDLKMDDFIGMCKKVADFHN